MPTVLVVEDDLRLQLIARKVLERAGYRVVLAGDGEQGVAAAATEAPDVVLMDISLPAMDGLEATRLILATQPDLPIVACTAHAMAGDRERMLAGGCRDFISKPYAIPDLLGAVAGCLSAPAR